MNTKFQRLIIVSILSGGVAASADVLELKNGTVLNGKFAGGNATAINFETSAGMQVIDRGQAVALTFTTQAPAAAPAAVTPVAAGAAAPPVGNSVSLPAGTTLLVRLMDPVSSQSAQGAKFSTGLNTTWWSGMPLQPRREPRFTARSPVRLKRDALLASPRLICV